MTLENMTEEQIKEKIEHFNKKIRHHGLEEYFVVNKFGDELRVMRLGEVGFYTDVRHHDTYRIKQYLDEVFKEHEKGELELWQESKHSSLQRLKLLAI